MDHMLLSFVLSFLGTVGFAVFFNVPKNTLFFCGLSGAFGWIVYLFLNENGNGVVFSIFLSSICVGVVAEILSRIMKKPVTAFIIPSIIPLVPGSGLYLTMLLLVQKDYQKGIEKGVETFFISGAIAIGLIITSSIAKSIKTIQGRKVSR
ncbi:MAG: threonine/serine exporter family protein [Filifactor alocis]|nr:threonine/serine exporter family protein [Filifactor alocis]